MAEIVARIPEKITWLLSKPKRVKIAVGGRGSGKSIGFADIMLMSASYGETICCTREFQNSIEDSVHSTLKDEIERLGAESFSVTDKGIRSLSGGRLFYKGLARNITSIKSLSGTDKLWIEEGESVSAKSLKVLTPSIRRKAGSDKIPEIWISMNRDSRQGAIAKKYLARAEKELAKTGYYEDDICMIVDINYCDNPWFTEELEQERLDDKERLSEEEYKHIWEGEYLEYVERALIKKEWFDAAIDAHVTLGIKPTGHKVAALDPADTGDDENGFVARKGIHVYMVEEIEADDANEACDKATDIAIKERVSLFRWDGDGLGATLRRQVSQNLEGERIEYEMHKGTFGVEDPKLPYDGEIYSNFKGKTKNIDVYVNSRAQYAVRLAERFYCTYLEVVKGRRQDPDKLISIDSSLSNLDKLRSECCRIPLISHSTGKIQLMSKKEMKEKYGIESPNLFDALAMTCKNVENTTITEIDIEPDSPWR